MTDKTHRFVVVGAGGVGSWLLEGLARMAEYKFPGSVITIVDGDTYEPKNKERQNFGELGNKARVMAMELQPNFPRTFILPDHRWIVAEVPEDHDGEDLVVATDLLEEGDIVYATVDNFAARKALFDAAREFDNIDIFTGGNDENLFGSTYHYQRKDGKDVIDHPADWHPELVDPPDRNPGLLSCGERVEIEGSTQILATNMAVAALLLGRTQKCIVDEKDDTESEIFFDMAGGVSQGYDRRVEETADDTSKELVSSTASNTGE